VRPPENRHFPKTPFLTNFSNQHESDNHTNDRKSLDQADTNEHGRKNRTPRFRLAGHRLHRGKSCQTVTDPGAQGTQADRQSGPYGSTCSYLHLFPSLPKNSSKIKLQYF
jgi:hypothetical protein